MSLGDFDSYYSNMAANKDTATQRVRVQEYNYWTNLIQEAVDSIMRHVIVNPPKEF